MSQRETNADLAWMSRGHPPQGAGKTCVQFKIPLEPKSSMLKYRLDAEC